MKIYNTLTKEIELFNPINEGSVNLFVCGPTVYDYSHIGHAKTYIQMDVIARFLKQIGYDVFYLQNITDIDDKILDRAQTQNSTWKDIANTFEEAYLKDMKDLHINSVTKYARATDHIPHVLSQITRLLDKGIAYKIEDGIYFEVSKFKNYGKLSGRSEVKKDDALARIDHSDEKKGWNDFCLWKFSNNNDASWDAPFGKGRPGWHIEDTAITESIFGEQYDIHGGAIDLIFPHHEAEISQMESLSENKPLAKYWTHTGFLNIDDSKMSKSTGNFITIRDVLKKGYTGSEIRLLILQSHYRSFINFSWDGLDSAKSRLASLKRLGSYQWQLVDIKSNKTEYTKWQADIKKAMESDFNTPLALATLSAAQNAIDGSLVSKLDAKIFKELLQFVDNVFGLGISNAKDITPDQKTLLLERQKARDQGNYELSDKVRKQLESQYIGVKDTPHGQVWFYI